MTNSHKLLIEEAPLQVLPTLAVKIGLNEAIFLQQLHYRLRVSVTVVEGRRWLHRTAEEWAEEMPFWSVPTIRRIVTTLRDSGLIMTRDDLNQMRIDRTLWYSINYSKIPGDEIESPDDEIVSPGDQVDHSSLSNRSHGYTGPGDQLDHTNNIRIKEREEERERARVEDVETSPPPSQKPDIFSDFVKSYEHIWGVMITPYQGDQIAEWASRITLPMWEYALKESLDKRSWKYLEKILERVQREGIKFKGPEPTVQAPSQPNEQGIQEEYKSTLPPGVVIDWGDLPMPLNWPKGDNS